MENKIANELGNQLFQDFDLKLHFTLQVSNIEIIRILNFN